MPDLKGAGDIPANDVWKAQMIGLYQTEVIIRRDEHVCMDTLRAKGVIQ